ncbi:MAG: helix-turn-helix transcriptional regulator, partial [Pseudomonadota bacterium]
GALAATQLRAAIASPRGNPLEHASPVRAAHQEPLGIKLGRLRRERGLTLAQVADALGVSKPTVWAWEKSKARPVRDRLPQIAEVLGVSGDELGQAASGTNGGALIEECRVRIAAAHRVHPANIRIMIEI